MPKLQPVRGDRRAHPGQRALHDPEMQGARDRLVLLALTERASVQEHRTTTPR
jgi:hypothetical protein